jgi:hypothetical protein
MRASLTVFCAARISTLNITTDRRVACRSWRHRGKLAPCPALGGMPQNPPPVSSSGADRRSPTAAAFNPIARTTLTDASAASLVSRSESFSARSREGYWARPVAWARPRRLVLHLRSRLQPHPSPRLLGASA